MNAPGSGVLVSLKSLISWWLTPRDNDRDKAFREGVLRSGIFIIIILATLSFSASVFVFRDEWQLLSFPTLHVFALASCAIIGFAILSDRLVVAGWLIVLLVIAGASGVLLLSRQNGSTAGIFLGVPAYAMVPVVAALVLPKSRILLVSMLSVVAYGLAHFTIPVSDFEIEGLNTEFMVPSVVLLLLFEGALLRQLREEFDARLMEMERSVRETEHAKQQAEAARQHAENADQAKSQFLANVSHELRTPLNAIIGYDEAMLAGMVGQFSPKQTELLTIIQHSARRLLTLINDILDLSKIEAGTIEIYHAPLKLRQVIRSTVDGLRGLAEEKRIYLTLSIADTAPETVISDRIKLEQVVTNLVSNAIKFTENGGVTVDVRCTDNQALTIAVTDTGIGIPPGEQETIFEPFRQVDGTLKRRYQGTGLGLSITRRVVEALGGSIDIDSKPGAGSVFTVVLPCEQPTPQTNSRLSRTDPT